MNIKIYQMMNCFKTLRLSDGSQVYVKMAKLQKTIHIIMHDMSPAG